MSSRILALWRSDLTIARALRSAIYTFVAYVGGVTLGATDEGSLDDVADAFVGSLDRGAVTAIGALLLAAGVTKARIRAGVADGKA